MAQEKQDFPVILLLDYLVVPNNLLLSLIGAPPLTPYTNILL